jgi:hypothetical protein
MIEIAKKKRLLYVHCVLNENDTYGFKSGVLTTLLLQSMRMSWTFSSSTSSFLPKWIVLHNRTLFSCMVVCSISFLASNMGLCYLTFVGRNLEIMKKLKPVQIMNSAIMISMEIVNDVGISNNNATMISILSE